MEAKYFWGYIKGYPPPIVGGIPSSRVLRWTMAITDSAIKRATPSDRPKKHPDGRGRYLLVTPAGRKLWRWNCRFQGKEIPISFGESSPSASRKFERNMPQRPSCSHEHIEFQLAHAPSDAARAAYNHALYLEPRTKIMQD